MLRKKILTILSFGLGLFVGIYSIFLLYSNLVRRNATILKPFSPNSSQNLSAPPIVSQSPVREEKEQNLGDWLTYTSESYAYTVRYPKGWRVERGVNEELRFSSPDVKYSMTGYMKGGISIWILAHPNPKNSSPEEWFTEEERKRYLTSSLRSIAVPRLKAFVYEADWGNWGPAVGALISGRNRMYRLDCFYPYQNTDEKQKCTDILALMLSTFLLSE